MTTLHVHIVLLRGVKGRQRFQALWRGCLTPLLTAVLVDTDIGDNPVQPGTKTPLWVIRLALLPGLQEGLLRGILGILRVVQHFPCNAIDAILIALHEEAKSLAVTLLHVGKKHLVAAVHADSPALRVA